MMVVMIVVGVLWCGVLLCGMWYNILCMVIGSIDIACCIYVSCVCLYVCIYV